MKPPAQKVIGGGDPMQQFHFRWPWKVADAGFTHQNSHQALAHRKFHADCQLRMDPAGAVGLPGRDVDSVDQTGEPQAALLSGR